MLYNVRLMMGVVFGKLSVFWATVQLESLQWKAHALKVIVRSNLRMKCLQERAKARSCSDIQR